MVVSRYTATCRLSNEYKEDRIVDKSVSMVAWVEGMVLSGIMEASGQWLTFSLS